MQPPVLNITLPSRTELGGQLWKWSSNEIKSQLPTEILLITVKDDEFRSCYWYLKRKRLLRSWCDNVGMVDFGRFGEQNGSRVALIKCDVGSVKAILTVKNAADILRPKVILCVGFCASVNSLNAKLGDVVISSKLATYDNKKITTSGSEHLLGAKVHISKEMGRLILSASDGWVPPINDARQRSRFKVHRQALMLSGSELVHCRKRRDKLLKHYPNAIGLETEGEGMRFTFIHNTCIDVDLLQAKSLSLIWKLLRAAQKVHYILTYFLPNLS